MDSVCTCDVLEMTMKLVNRIILVTAHIVRATNMRMIICFMILILSSCDLPKARTAPLICGARLGRAGDKSSKFRLTPGDVVAVRLG